MIKKIELTKRNVMAWGIEMVFSNSLVSYLEHDKALKLFSTQMLAYVMVCGKDEQFQKWNKIHERASELKVKYSKRFNN